MDFGTPSIYVGSTPPTDPVANPIWISTALADARFPGHPGETYVAYQPPVSQPSVQEPNVWVYRGIWYMLANNAGAQYLYTAPNPRGPWTQIQNVLGAGVGGEASDAVHAGLYTENEVVYLFYTSNNVGRRSQCFLAVASMAALANAPGTAFKYAGIVLQSAGGVLPGLTAFGNFACIKNDNEYWLYFEATYGSASDSFVTGLAVGSALQGTFIVRNGLLYSMAPMQYFGMTDQIPFPPVPASSTELEGYRSFYAAGPVFYENNQFVQLFHSGQIAIGDGGPNSDLYRGTSVDGMQWRVDLWGYPIYAKTDIRFELDQAADIFPVQSPNGAWWAFWAAAWNPAGRFCIKCCPLSPTMKMWDGYNWIQVDQTPPPTLSRQLMRRPRYATTGQPVFPFDDLPVDPGATAGFSVVLPPGAVSMQIAISNISTGVGTVAVTPSGTDVILGTNAAINPGECAVFKCMAQLSGVARWVRLGY